MKCHAGVEFPSGKPCPKCGASLGEVCWPGINADLAELPNLRAIESAARDYFMCAVQDEADDLECCVTERQHELAKALRDALALTRALARATRE